jgi:hypothetical protein
MERKAAAVKEMDSLMDYRRALSDDDKGIFDRLLGFAKEHASACARAGTLNLSESMLLAIALEQQKKIDALVAERGDSRTRNPPEPESARSRPQDLDLFAILNPAEAKAGPPWVVS